MQYDTRTPDIEYNSQLAERLIREAKANGADVVLFPECFLTAYAAPDICERSVGMPDCMPFDAPNDAPTATPFDARSDALTVTPTDTTVNTPRARVS